MLTEILRVSQDPASDEQVQRLNAVRETFGRFAGEYPESVFADDSQFLYCLFEFIGALMVPPVDLQDAGDMILMMEKTVESYPEGRLEALTYSILEKELGRDSVTGSFLIPYGHMVDFMRAVLANHVHDYKTAIPIFKALKQEFFPLDDERIAAEIYVGLYTAYAGLGYSRDIEALIREVSLNYPGSKLERMLLSLSHSG